MAIARAAGSGNWKRAAEYQAKVIKLRDLLVESRSIMGAFTAIMNARDIPGNFHAAPCSALDESARQRLLSTPIMKELLDAPVAVQEPLAE